MNVAVSLIDSSNPKCTLMAEITHQKTLEIPALKVLLEKVFEDCIPFEIEYSQRPDKVVLVEFAGKHGWFVPKNIIRAQVMRGIFNKTI